MTNDERVFFMYATTESRPATTRRRRPRYRRHRRHIYIPNPMLLLLPAIIALLAVGVKADQKVAELEKPTTSEKINLFFDREAPQIHGVKDLFTYAGDALSYREDIYLTDNRDESPRLTVDSAKVDLSQPGTYEVIYTAKDASSNKTTASATVTVLEKQEGYVDMQTIYAAVDVQLDKILMSGMTEYQQVEAIYQWARSYLMYAGHTTRGSYHQAGYEMLTNGSGDCYGYFAVTKLMLERLGIPNIDVQKVKRNDTDSEHFWSLVSVDGGVTYYHLDTTPRLGGDDIFLMVSDADLDAYSDSHNHSHNRDATLYPATPEVSYGK